MSYLKNDCIKTCFNLLEEFITETGEENKKGPALLALNQLKRITAGTDLYETSRSCTGRPRAEII